MTVSKIKDSGRYADGHGLYLQVSEWGTKSWIFRYMRNGRARHMGLGPLHTLSLAEARERARKARQALLDGIDPIDLRMDVQRAAKADAAKRTTFKDAAEKYIAAHKAGWKNTKHADQWEATLKLYAYPIIGGLTVADIGIGHITNVLEPIWLAKTETASRVRGRVEAILDWATVRGHRTGDNPARWRGCLDKLLPAKTKVRRVKHMAAMPYADVASFIGELRDRPGFSGKALQFAIFTACRTGEVTGARWDEIDLTEQLWSIPGERTKSGRQHRVPLSKPAMTLLTNLPCVKNEPFIFPGGKEGAGLSNMAMLELLREMRGKGLTVHGFRSSFRDWCAEQTNFPREIAEAALAHVLKDKTEAAYQRGDLLEKRRKLMEAWSSYCTRPAATADNVRQLRAAG
ncbi:tyrosine-type recombinase/integrase [Hyphomicrobium sulfonivorans]|uniref:tyrosine-type recombinase/integrase n=1 Tax=Hyphomicrobium sulfonivorans TaxID=121290 RepID=UPI00156E7537|nr:site-specific integrase [Hyphomicrobium sulfonivorans]MBI1650111.1 integrase arm-type DNA-binding domain-containing protein [Hyphomicrobium sulfonivorans]NSL73027.1 integrase [Hyphomicrobium sulfonivorans]